MAVLGLTQNAEQQLGQLCVGPELCPGRYQESAAAKHSFFSTLVLTCLRQAALRCKCTVSRKC